MSRASERKAMKDTLPAYPLMTVKDVCGFLHCKADHVRGMAKDGTLKASNIGRGKTKELRFDPVDVIVLHLAQREGSTSEEFWEVHGPDGTVEACRRFVVRIRKLAA